MTLRNVLSAYYRKKASYLCLRCLVASFFATSFFVGTPTSATCKHDEEIKCDFRISPIGILASYLCGSILSILSVYRLRTSYETELNFWHLKNLKTIGEFAFGAGAGLVILCLIKNYKIFNKLLRLMQVIICKLKSIESEAEIVERYATFRLRTDVYIAVSLIVSVFCVWYKYVVEDDLDVTLAVGTFVSCDTIFGLCLLMEFHKIALTFCYDRLERVLEFTPVEQHTGKLANVQGVGEDLDLFLDFRLICYQSFCHIKDLLFLQLYVYLVNGILVYCIMLVMIVVKVLNGEIFDVKDEYVCFIGTSLVVVLVSCYACYFAESMVHMDDFMKSFIYRCRLGKLLEKNISKVEELLTALETQRCVVEVPGLILVSNKLSASMAYISITYAIVGLQFYMANEATNDE